jgi:hypothetical protein
MARRFPKAWAHLRKWEKELRARESSGFDDDEWYRFGRNQNIDKQDVLKLIVPRLVEHLKCSLDVDGSYCLDNVDVGGILPTANTEPAYLMAVLNGPICDFVFRIISKPFQNDYRSANKQFIAPLPVPRASAEARADVAARAQRLQERWTERRNLLREASDRLGVLARARRPARWLWSDLPELQDLIGQAPRSLRLAGDKREWAQHRLDDLAAGRLEALQAALARSGRWDVQFAKGELRLFAAGSVVIDRIYLDDAVGRLTEAYWRFLLLKGRPREADRFAAELRRPPAEPNAPAAVQFVERVAALAAEVVAIERDERAMNEVLYGLYGLSPAERNLVENEQERRNGIAAAG